jgi:hypothetical protein
MASKAIEPQQIYDRGSLVDWLDADLRLTRSDLPVINKIDLFTNLKSGEGVEHISEFSVVKGSLEPRQ